MTNELQKTNENLPDFIREMEDSNEGFEHVGRADIKMPTLALAQKMSPQLDSSDPAYIDGLQFLDMFNTLTGTNYGPGPLPFYIIKAEPPFGILYEGKGRDRQIVERGLATDDPRMQWGRDDEGNQVKPMAELIYQYVFVLEDDMSPIGVRMKSTNVKTARNLNGLIMLRKKPLYLGRYFLRSVKAANPEGFHAEFSVENAGWVDNAEGAAALQHLFESFKDKVVEMHEEAEVDDEPLGDKF